MGEEEREGVCVCFCICVGSGGRRSWKGGRLIYKYIKYTHTHTYLIHDNDEGTLARSYKTPENITMGAVTTGTVCVCVCVCVHV